MVSAAEAATHNMRMLGSLGSAQQPLMENAWFGDAIQLGLKALKTSADDLLGAIGKNLPGAVAKNLDEVADLGSTIGKKATVVTGGFTESAMAVGKNVGDIDSLMDVGQAAVKGIDEAADFVAESDSIFKNVGTVLGKNAGELEEATLYTRVVLTGVPGLKFDDFVKRTMASMQEFAENISSVTREADELAAASKRTTTAAADLSGTADAVADTSVPVVTKAGKTLDLPSAKGVEDARKWYQSTPLRATVGLVAVATITGIALKRMTDTNNKSGNITSIVVDKDTGLARVNFTPGIPLHMQCTIDIIGSNCVPSIDGNGQSIVKVISGSSIILDHEITTPGGFSGVLTSHSDFVGSTSATLQDAATKTGETAGGVAGAGVKGVASAAGAGVNALFAGLGIDLAKYKWWIVGVSGILFLCFCLCVALKFLR